MNHRSRRWGLTYLRMALSVSLFSNPAQAASRLPQWLHGKGPWDLRIWQLLLLVGLVLAAWLLGVLLSRLTRWLLGKVVVRTAAGWDDALLARMGGPVTLVWALGSFELSLYWLDLSERAKDSVDSVVRGGFFFVFFWILSRLIEVGGSVLTSSGWAIDHPAARSLVPLGVRIGKVVVLVIAVVAFVSALGYPIASLVAGLGVGGVAVALAAQKTVENLFGAFSIGADRPFREGDFVKVEDVTGTVESVGLRSTRIRTLDRTLVTYPNGKLSEMRLECYSARDRIRLFCRLGICYQTTADQMRTILRGVEAALRAHPKLWPDSVAVHFAELGESALQIEVMAWFLAADFDEFKGIRQEMLLSFMEVVQAAGTSMAYPTRTVHLVPSSA